MIPKEEESRLFYKYHGIVSGRPETLWQRNVNLFIKELPGLRRLIFDDGLKTQHTVAFPLLKEEKAKRTLYCIFAIVTNIIGGPSWMTWEQVSELASEFDLASHSHTHPDLTILTFDEVKKEIEVSKNIIEEKTGKKCRYFTAPYDRYNSNVYKACKELELVVIENRFLVKSDSDLPSGDDYWNEVYSGTKVYQNAKKEQGGHEHLRIAEVDKHLEGNRILDVGAGYGDLAKTLKTKYPEKEFVCLDQSEIIAKKSGYKPYVISKGESMPFKDKEFDILTCLQTMEYMEDDDLFLKEAKRVSKKGIFTATNGTHQLCQQLKTYDMDKFLGIISKYGKIEQNYIIHSMLFVKVNFDEV